MSPYQPVLARPSTNARAHLLAAILLFLLALLVYAPLLATGRIPYGPYSDIIPFHLANKEVLQAALRAGTLPLWRDDWMLGAPALTDPQTLYLHPLQVLFFWLPVEQAFGPTFVLELWVAALGAYALARTLGRSVLASLLAGIAELVCFKLIMACYAGWSSVLPPIALLPALAASLLQLTAAPSWRSGLGFTTCVALVLSGGAPQLAFYLVLMLSVPLAWLVWHNLREQGRAYPLRLLVIGTGALSLGVACTAYLWIPLVSELPWLSRATQSYDFFLSGHALSVGHLVTWFFPEGLGTPRNDTYPTKELWEDVAYFGVIPLVGAVAALVRARKLSTLDRLIGLAFVLSALLSLSTPLLRFTYDHVPGYALFRMPGRMLFVTALLGIALASSSFDSLLSRFRGTTRSLFALALALPMLLEGAVYARLYLQTASPESVLATASHPVRALAASAPGRWAVVGRTAFNYGGSASAGLEVMNGYNPYALTHYVRYMSLAEQGTTDALPLGNWYDLHDLARVDLLQEAAVYNVVSNHPLSDAALTLTGVHPEVRSFLFYWGMVQRTLYTYAVRDSRAWARFATQTEAVDSQQQLLLRMQREPLTGQAYVVQTKHLPVTGPGPTDASVTVERPHPGHALLRTRASATGLLVVAETWHPGWRAQVDDRPAEVLQTNLALLGVSVPAGDHRVELDFQPLHFQLAWRISTCAWALWLLLMAAAATATLRRRTGRAALATKVRP